MRWFGRRNKSAEAGLAGDDSGASSSDSCDETDAANPEDELHRHCVNTVLGQASEQASEMSVPIEGEFTFIITEISPSVLSHQAIMYGLMMGAGDYGLRCVRVGDEDVVFVRIG